MQNWLTNHTKKRIIREIRSILQEHPKYRKDANNVQNKYSFQERPQRGVIIRNTSADRVRLSADNYMGRLTSFVMQAQVEGVPNTSIEWVTENLLLLEQYSPTRNVFPTPPGVYIIDIETLPDPARNLPGKYYIDPILNEQDEPLIRFQTGSDDSAQLSHQNIYPGSVRLWLNGRVSLANNVDFSVNHETGEVTFLKNTPADDVVYADYRYQLDRQGPYDYYYESTDMTAIPGAIIAFGDRAQVCDKIAIVVGDTRAETAEVYGGKFEVNFDLLTFVQGDAEEREKMTDYIIIKILERQNKLGYEGLELVDISPGGESEEIYIEGTDQYYYDGSISLTMKVDWEIYQPLPINVLRIIPESQAEEQEKGYLDGTYTLDLLRMTLDPVEVAGLIGSIGKKLSFERIK